MIFVIKIEVKSHPHAVYRVSIIQEELLYLKYTLKRMMSSLTFDMIMFSRQFLQKTPLLPRALFQNLSPL